MMWGGEKGSGIPPPGPGDMLWEYESTLHGALVINKAVHQGHLE